MESLEASRELLQKTIALFEKEGLRLEEDLRTHLRALMESLSDQILSGHRILQKTKLHLIFRFLKSFEGSMGLSIKAAQLASFIEAGIPSEVSTFLGYIQESGEPIPFAKVQESIEQELGSSWQEHFRQIKRKPLAVTSLAQLHLAELHSGEKVIVKVKHPEIETILKSQFGKLAFLTRLAEFLGQKAEPICREIEQLVHRELDYEKEIYNQSVFEIFLRITRKSSFQRSIENSPQET